MTADIASASDLWVTVDLPERRMAVDKANRNHCYKTVDMMMRRDERR